MSEPATEAITIEDICSKIVQRFGRLLVAQLYPAKIGEIVPPPAVISLNQRSNQKVRIVKQVTLEEFQEQGNFIAALLGRALLPQEPNWYFYEVESD